MSTPIPWERLSVRTTNLLKNAECETVEDVSRVGFETFRDTLNCGRKSLNEMADVLEVWPSGYRGKQPSDAERAYKAEREVGSLNGRVAYLERELAAKQRIIDAFEAGYAQGRLHAANDIESLADLGKLWP